MVWNEPIIKPKVVDISSLCMQQCNLCMRKTRCLFFSTVTLLLGTDLTLHTEVQSMNSNAHKLL